MNVIFLNTIIFNKYIDLNNTIYFPIISIKLIEYLPE